MKIYTLTSNVLRQLSIFLFLTSSMLMAYESGEPSVIIEKDERVPSNNPAIGRIITIVGNTTSVCTGWLTWFGAVITAGHCDKGSGATNTLQFNVPLSTADGKRKKPTSDTDIYNLTFIASMYNNSNDWAIARAEPNKKLTPVLRQKSFIRLSTPPATDEYLTLRVTGYGLDGPPPGYGIQTTAKNKYNLTQQAATGPYSSRLTTYEVICYQVDTQPADSGGPVLINGTQTAVAIHVAGVSDNFCGENPPYNAGTVLSQPDLVTAMQSFPGQNYSPPVSGTNTIFVDEGTSSPGAMSFSPGGNMTFTPDGKVLSPYLSIEEALIASENISSSLIVIAPGNYAIDKDFTLTVAHDPTLSFPAGGVTIYPIVE